MKTAADLQVGDVVYIGGQPFTVKSVHTSDGNTTLVFEDVTATKERCEALKKLARDAGGSAAMVPVPVVQQISPDAFLLNEREAEMGVKSAAYRNWWWFNYMTNGPLFCEHSIDDAQQQSWANSNLRKWIDAQFDEDAEDTRRYLNEQHQPESGSGDTGHEGRS